MRGKARWKSRYAGKDQVFQDKINHFTAIIKILFKSDSSFHVSYQRYKKFTRGKSLNSNMPGTNQLPIFHKLAVDS